MSGDSCLRDTHPITGISGERSRTHLDFCIETGGKEEMTGYREELDSGNAFVVAGLYISSCLTMDHDQLTQVCMHLSGR
jgi:hypothetical protein